MKKTLILAAAVMAAQIGTATAAVPVTDGDTLAQAMANGIDMPDPCGKAKTVDGEVAQMIGPASNPDIPDRAFITLKCGDGTYRGIRLVDPARYVPAK